MVSLDITNYWRRLTQTFAGSDVIYLNILGQGIIILDSSEAIMDLLERRSSIYSDRPKVPMIRDLMGFDFSLPMIPYGKNQTAQPYDAEMKLTRKAMVRMDKHVCLRIDVNAMIGVHSGN
jgi:hypothetical protein